MKATSILMLFMALICGCNNTNSEKKPSNTDSLKINVPSATNAKPIYVTHKVDLDIDTAKADTIFIMDSVRVQISINLGYIGDYVVSDTVCANDTCHISLYRNHCAHIIIKSPEEKEVVVAKDFFWKSIKAVDLSGYIIGTTTIDSVATGAKQIILSTFLGYPQSDFGYYAIYSVSLDGKLKFIKTIDDSEDEED